MKRKATATWSGSGKDGNGHLTTQSSILSQTHFSFNSRFGEEAGTNPEELVAAAHASCFTMKLSFILDEAGFTKKSLETNCSIKFENGTITESHLVVKASIDKISQEVFAACVKEAELCGPVSRILNIKITVEATLEK